MDPAQLEEVIAGIIEDHDGHTGEPACLAEALAESWLKDRRRALAQQARDELADTEGRCPVCDSPDPNCIHRQGGRS
jgi:hypothetical protein